MKQFLVGLLVGTIFAGTLVSAGTFYDSAGKPAAPRGSVEQFDYFRGRQALLDIQAQRRLAEQNHLRSLTTPCGK